MTFTDYYAQQSCTAGRAAFITGQNPIRTGLTKVGMPGATVGLQTEDPTIAELLKPLGYATGQFGKNHLGDRDEFLPTVHGFDEFFGNLYHLNAEEEPELPDYPKDPEFKKKFGPRGVLHCLADGKGGQTIKDTGPLTKKRMETIDEEITDGALDWMEKRRGCESHHVHPSLWRATGVRGVLAIVGREGRAPFSAARRPRRRSPTRAPSWRGASCAPTGLRARRFSPPGPAWPATMRRRCGSARASWPRSRSTAARCGSSPRTPRRSPTRPPRRRPAAGRTSTRWLRAATASCWWQTRARKRIWTVLGGPGVVLADGAVAGPLAPGEAGQAARRDRRAVRPGARRAEDELAGEAGGSPLPRREHRRARWSD